MASSARKTSGDTTIACSGAAWTWRTPRWSWATWTSAWAVTRTSSSWSTGFWAGDDGRKARDVTGCLPWKRLNRHLCGADAPLDVRRAGQSRQPGSLRPSVRPITGQHQAPKAEHHTIVKVTCCKVDSNNIRKERTEGSQSLPPAPSLAALAPPPPAPTNSRTNLTASASPSSTYSQTR